jgi:hypothetical protein
MHSSHCLLSIHPSRILTYSRESNREEDLIVESEESLALGLLKGLGVGWVSRGTSWDTEWHDGRVLPSANYRGI